MSAFGTEFFFPGSLEAPRAGDVTNELLVVWNTPVKPSSDDRNGLILVCLAAGMFATLRRLPP